MQQYGGVRQEVEESVEDGFSFDLYTGIPSWVENREVVRLRNTSCYKSVEDGFSFDLYTGIPLL